jgi:hypothetical protein
VNCKPGDLAYVADEKRLMLRCLGCGEERPALTFGHPLTVTTVAYSTPEGGPVWRLKEHVSIHVQFGCGMTVNGQVAGVCDAALRPIRDPGDDAVDEMVAKLGAAPKWPAVPVLNQQHAEDFAKAAAEHYRNNPPVGRK